MFLPTSAGCPGSARGRICRVGTRTLSSCGDVWYSGQQEQVVFSFDQVYLHNFVYVGRFIAERPMFMWLTHQRITGPPHRLYERLRDLEVQELHATKLQWHDMWQIDGAETQR
jgi:hypothetical protein